jgi:hypothetical protein
MTSRKFALAAGTFSTMSLREACTRSITWLSKGRYTFPRGRTRPSRTGVMNLTIDFGVEMERESSREK